MSDFKQLEQEIESVRASLHKLVEQKDGNLIDHEVAALSIQLDKLIVEYEKNKDAKVRS